MAPERVQSLHAAARCLPAAIVRAAKFAACALLVAGAPATVQAQPQVGGEFKRAGDEYLLVHCLLPGQVRALGTRMVYSTPRRPIIATAHECGVRGGEFAIEDRASGQGSLKHWLAAAEDKGLSEAERLNAQTLVGELYEGGAAGAPNPATAAIWYRKAADRGHGPAQFNLARLYERGLGVAQDRTQAAEWYRKAYGLKEGELAEVVRPVDAAEVAGLKQQIEQQALSIAALNDQIVRLEADIAQRESLLASAGAAQAKLKQDLDAKSAQLAQARKGVGEASRELSALRQTVSAETGGAGDTLRKVQQAQADLDAERKALAAREAALAKREQAVFAKAAAFAAKIAADLGAAGVAQTERQALATERASLANQLKELESAQARREKEEAALIASQAELARLRASMEQRAAAAAKAQSDLARREAELEQRLAAAERAETEQARLAVDLASAGMKTAAGAVAAGDLARREAALNSAGQALEQARAALKAKQGEIDAARASLAAERKAMSAEIEAHKAQLAKSGSSAAALATLRSELDATRKSIEAREASLAEREAKAVAANAAAAKAMADARKSLDAERNQLAAERAAIVKASADLDAKRAKFGATEAELAARLAKAQARENDVVQREREADDRAAKLAKAEGDAQALRSQLAKTAAKITQDRTQVEAARKELQLASVSRDQDPWIELSRPRAVRSGTRAPNAELEAPGETIEVIGKAYAPRGLARVVVNGQPVQVAADNTFRHKVDTRAHSGVWARVEDKTGAPATVMVPFATVRRGVPTTAAVARPTKVDRSIYGDFHALLIANQNYDQVEDLRTPHADVEEAGRILRERYGFKVRIVKDASRAELLKAISEMDVGLDENDNLLIYYAGHGIYQQDVDTGFWLPTDADPKSDDNWIDAGDLQRKIRESRARKVLVVSDSCFAGAMTRSPKPAAPFMVSAAKRSRMFLAAGGLTEVLDEDPRAGGAGKTQHSVFGRAFIEVLRANSEIVEGGELFLRIKGLVRERATKVNFDQEPEYDSIVRANHEGGDFIFVPSSAVR